MAKQPAPPRPRTPDPELTFFADPALDRALGVVFAMATELYVVRDRLASLEAQLAARGALDAAALAAEPSPQDLAARAKERDAFVAHLMEPLLGQMPSKRLPKAAPHGEGMVDRQRRKRRRG